MIHPRHIVFLKDVMTLTFSAFGGPQAHIALMLQILVRNRKYLTEAEFIELNALCQMLPGPTSTQTITAIGYKKGGAILALLTLVVWVLPAGLIMTFVSLFFTYFKDNDISFSLMKFIPPLAVGFVVYASYRITKVVVKDWVGILLVITSANLTLFYPTPWMFPITLVIGGIVTNFTSKEKPAFRFSKPRFNWGPLIIFGSIFVLAAALGGITKSKPIILFENFYRFGSLIFGGGQVLIPMMYEQFVSYKEYLTSDEFLSGFGIVQSLPGPVFSFATFTGGMAMAGEGTARQLLGCLVGTIGIFLPGTLLIFFVYPFWEYLKKYTLVKKSLEGVNATASGLVVAAAIILIMQLEGTWINGIIVSLVVILNFINIPAPLLVFIALLAGLIF